MVSKNICFELKINIKHHDVWQKELSSISIQWKKNNISVVASFIVITEINLYILTKFSVFSVKNKVFHICSSITRKENRGETLNKMSKVSTWVYITWKDIWINLLIVPKKKTKKTQFLIKSWGKIL